MKNDSLPRPVRLFQQVNEQSGLCRGEPARLWGVYISPVINQMRDITFFSRRGWTHGETEAIQCFAALTWKTGELQFMFTARYTSPNKMDLVDSLLGTLICKNVMHQILAL